MYEHGNSQNYSLDFDLCREVFYKMSLLKRCVAKASCSSFFPLYAVKKNALCSQGRERWGMILSWSSGESGLSNLVNYLKNRERVTLVAHLCRFNLQKYKGVLSLLSKNESNYKILPCFLGDGAMDLSRIWRWVCGELFYTHLVDMSNRNIDLEHNIQNCICVLVQKLNKH